jgi:peptide/nickel transport system ATP-binding protein
MSDIVLEAVQLSVDAHGADGKSRRVLDNVSFVLPRNSVLGVIGESGAGKSTLGLAALGHFRNGLRPSAGRLSLGGVDMLTLSERRARELRGARIAYVAQAAASAFTPSGKLIDQVIETALVRRLLTKRDAVKRAIELFALLGLPEPERFGERYPHQVSGGQLQRAMTAMALCASPEVIVFDEPTTALDAATRDQVLATHCAPPAPRRFISATICLLWPESPISYWCYATDAQSNTDRRELSSMHPAIRTRSGY